MPSREPTLHMLCGRIASGKSTLAAELARAKGTVLISEDIWLDALYADRMSSVRDYVRCAARLRGVMGPHVAAVLEAGTSVVLDFPANTVETRAWMRGILERTAASHVLHVLDASDAVCLSRLQQRNAGGDHPFVVTDAEFRRITAHFVLPAPEEGFEVVVHRQMPLP